MLLPNRRPLPLLIVKTHFLISQNVSKLFTQVFDALVPFLLTFYVPNLGSRTQNMTSLAF